MESTFFQLSKIIWEVVKLDTVLFILLVVTWFLLSKSFIRQGKYLLGFVVIVMLVVATLPLSQLLLSTLEKRFPTNPKLPDKIDGIIVLSGSEDPVLTKEWRQAEFNGSVERNLMFLKLAKQYPSAKLVYTGGSGSLINQDDKQADVAKKLYEDMGLDLSRVIFERNARNTYENAINSKKLINPIPMDNWILITSARHIPRAFGVFCKSGWDVIPYPVDHVSHKNTNFSLGFNLSGGLSGLTFALKEWVGLFAYYITGKTSDLFPKVCV